MQTKNLYYVIGFIFLILVVFLSGSLYAQTQIYVSVTGDDDNGSGTSESPYKTIQKAINVASANDIIVVNAGIYTEDLSIPSDKDNLELKAASGALVTLKGVADVDVSDWPLADPNIEILSEGVKIHGFTIESPDYTADRYSSGIIIGASDVEIYDNTFKTRGAANSDEISQIIQTYYKDALSGVNISGLSIHDNTFTHLGSSMGSGYEGIYLNLDEGTGGVEISNNQFTGDLVRAITTERSNITIEGNKIVTSLPVGLPGGYQGINIGGANKLAMSNVTLEKDTIKGFESGKGFSDGVSIGSAGHAGLTAINITESLIDGNANGIHVKVSAGGVSVNNNSIINSTTYGIQNEDIDNSLDATLNWWGSATGPFHTTLNTAGTGSPVSDNVLFTPWLDAADGNRTAHIFIDKNDNGTYSTGDVAYMTIQEAITGASANDVIVVKEGKFTEDLSIGETKTNLKMIGSGASTIIKGVEELDWPTHAPAILILASGVKIHGFTIESPDYSRTSGNPHSSGITVGSANVEIYENTFSATDDGTGNSAGWTTLIETYGQWGGDVSGLYIHDNTFTSNTGTDKGSEGIFINYNLNNPNPTGTVTIENNIFEGQLFRAISSERSKTVISENTIGSSYSPGAAFNAALRGIDITSGQTGADNHNPNQDLVSITDNAISGFWQGIRLGGTDNTLTNITIEQNTLQSNDYAVKVYLSQSAATGININNNRIINNNIYGIENADIGTLNSKNNWWGNITGPFHTTLNTAGTGSPVSDNVLFTPWLDADDGNPTAHIFIDKDGNNTYSTGDAAYMTIQEAITGASANDIIVVNAGTYTEDLTVDKVLTLQGAGASSVTVIGSHNITSGNVTIDGFTFDMSGSGIVMTYNTQTLSSNITGGTISNNIFTMDTAPSIGIWLGNGDGYLVSNMTINNNTFNGPDNKVANPIKVGGGFNSPLNAAVSSLTFSNNTVNYASTPIELNATDLDGISITGNTYNNTDGAVYLWAQNEGSVPAGKLLNFTFSNNTVDATNSYGLALGIDQTNNGFLDDTNFGTGITVSNNTFGKPEEYPYATTAYPFNLYSVSLTADVSSFVLNAESNYWDAVSGPTNSSNPSGTGATVYGNVDFIPWLDAEGGNEHVNIFIDDDDDETYDTGEDVFATIQTAIDGANANDIVVVNAGTYTEDLTVDKVLTLQGAGASSVTVIGSHNITAGNVTIDGFTFDMSGSGVVMTYNTLTLSSNITSGTISNNIFTMDTAPSIGIWLGNGAGYLVSNVTINNNTFNGPDNKVANPIKVGGGFNSPLNAAVSSLTFSNNMVNYASTPIELNATDLDGISITGNTYSNTDGAVYLWAQNEGSVPAGELLNFTFSNNTVDATNSYGLALGIDQTNNGFLDDTNFGTGITVSNNTFGKPEEYPYATTAYPFNLYSVSLTADVSSFILNAENNYWDAVSGPTNSLNPSGTGATVYGNVDFIPWLDSEGGDEVIRVFIDDDDDETYDTGEDAFANIQLAIDGANAGDVIIIKAGTYSEDLDVTQSLTIKGLGETTVIDPPAGSYGFKVTADNVTLQNLKISIEYLNGSSNDAGIQIVEADNVTIDNCIIEGTAGTVSADGVMGIWVSGSSNGTAPSNNLTVSGNTINITGVCTGIYAAHSNPPHSGWIIGGSAADSNMVTASGGVNIELYDVNNSTVSYNVFNASGLNNMTFSSELSNITDGTISNNKFLGSGLTSPRPELWIETDFILGDGSSTITGLTINDNTFSDWNDIGIVFGEGSYTPGGSPPMTGTANVNYGNISAAVTGNKFSTVNSTGITAYDWSDGGVTWSGNWFGDYAINSGFPDQYVINGDAGAVDSDFFVYGDVTKNGEISAYDASYILQYVVDLITFDSGQISRADVSGNGSIHAYDATLVLMKIASLITEFPILSGLTKPLMIFNPDVDYTVKEYPDKIFIEMNLNNTGNVYAIESNLYVNHKKLKFTGIKDCNYLIQSKNKGEFLKIALASTVQISNSVFQLEFKKTDKSPLSEEDFIVKKTELNETVFENVEIFRDYIEIPEVYSLKQNYPNPFNPDTKIEFTLPKFSEVTLEIYNVLGQNIRTLVDTKLEAGSYEVTWDSMNNEGFRVPSGVYFCRIKADKFIKTRKMTLTK